MKMICICIIWLICHPVLFSQELPNKPIAIPDSGVAAYDYTDKEGNRRCNVIARKMIPPEQDSSIAKKLPDDAESRMIEVSKIEEGNAYLWNSIPYPIPGRNEIKSQIFWNRIYKVDEVGLNVYDINGVKIQTNNLKIDKTQDYSGILRWECSDVLSGIYIIQISLAGESISFPVIVIK